MTTSAGVRRISRRIGALLAACAALASSSARAEESTCPTVDEVWTAVATLMSRDRAPQMDSAARPELRIDDLGDHYRVSIRDRTRDFVDESRDCARRAETAAVFVTLTLAPPDVAVGPPPAPTATPSPAPTAILPAAPSAPLTEPRPAGSGAEIAALVQGSPWSGAEQAVLAPGLLARAVWARPVGAFTASVLADVVFAAPTTLETAVGPIRQLRVPMAVGARISRQGRRLDLAAEVAVIGAALRVDASALAAGRSLTRLDAGVRFGVQATLATSGVWAPFLGLACDLMPRGYELAVVPDGVVARTTRVWLGATLGVAVRFR